MTGVARWRNSSRLSESSWADTDLSQLWEVPTSHLLSSHILAAETEQTRHGARSGDRKPPSHRSSRFGCDGAVADGFAEVPIGGRTSTAQRNLAAHYTSRGAFRARQDSCCNLTGRCTMRTLQTPVPRSQRRRGPPLAAASRYGDAPCDIHHVSLHAGHWGHVTHRRLGAWGRAEPFSGASTLQNAQS